MSVAWRLTWVPLRLPTSRTTVTVATKLHVLPGDGGIIEDNATVGTATRGANTRVQQKTCPDIRAASHQQRRSGTRPASVTIRSR